MTQNEIDIIKREVAARLPYGVKVSVTNSTVYKDPMTVLGIDYSKEIVKVGENIDGMFFTHNERAADVKPYLRPMDSMTDGERKELLERVLGLDTRFEVKQDGGIETVDPNNLSYVYFGAETTSRYTDWLNQRMFDYRGSIGLGSAVAAPVGMYDFSD